MKTLIKSLVIISALCLFINMSYAQKMYQIHQDNVKPSMVSLYEKTAKEFTEACNKHNPQAPWITATTGNMRYLYISPLENFATLDENVFSDMRKAMGDSWSNIFKNFNKCYDSHSDYIITLSEKLSYMPEGITQMQEGQNYRNWYYLYYTPENGENILEAIKGVKELFKSKASKSYYRIYRSGFGCPESFYLVAVSSKDELDSAIKGKANQETLGEDRKAVFGNLMQYVSRFEEITGEMRPDISYSPKSN
ncbi:hypothetical protein [Thalassobellus suaedae]|uniref:Uncharacterized protein n=1 Tax=Thalassobellus suaedae TaxID=3074124 RepID=A0ABY9XWQ1_9FLAO|nr:hypothetical protein RHP51_06940 [Flavobacteriaceae bacterium HL-DH14]